MTVELTTPSEREVVLTRAFAARRGVVFQAMTEPSLLVRWYGARGWNLAECEVDLRVGGAYRFQSRGPDGVTMTQRGVYRAVVRPELVSFTELFDDQSYDGESLITHRFVELAGRTTVTSTVLFASPQARDTALRYPMRRGVGESYERLDELLAHDVQP